MNYLYHMVPRTKIEGDTLYPLNVLREKYPEVYEREVGKYVGREHVTKIHIPYFDCEWSDVLHMGAIKPHDLKGALVEAGMDESTPMSFYQIDPSILNPDLVVVYLNKKREKGTPPTEIDFVPFRIKDIERYSHINQETRDIYKTAFDAGKKPLIFALIPHILYKGSIEVGEIPIITV